MHPGRDSGSNDSDFYHRATRRSNQSADQFPVSPPRGFSLRLRTSVLVMVVSCLSEEAKNSALLCYPDTHRQLAVLSTIWNSAITHGGRHGTQSLRIALAHRSAILPVSRRASTVASPEPKAPHREKRGVDLQPLTSIQQSIFTPQPAPSRAPITLTVCVTICPSTTSRQHYSHRTDPLYMRGTIIFRSLLRSW